MIASRNHTSTPVCTLLYINCPVFLLQYGISVSASFSRQARCVASTPWCISRCARFRPRYFRHRLPTLTASTVVLEDVGHPAEDAVRCFHLKSCVHETARILTRSCDRCYCAVTSELRPSYILLNGHMPINCSKHIRAFICLIIVLSRTDSSQFSVLSAVASNWELLDLQGGQRFAERSKDKLGRRWFALIASLGRVR
ncbi:hypothetical protein P879_08231 [Paragonimus westermani]|uniref:Uncharacterized protein n=1 Tax=Paragonimus westermani TaxID=34504 RepID=A0A8T0D6Y9_9TREM|nr:hypothetical protein P879_08231 [Paragonimus westermani]